jgi:hypothetical protein
MTIAACYLSSEGAVLGADSTTTFTIQPPGSATARVRHLNHAQKIFQVGAGGTLGVVTWGMGSVGAKSHRTRVAEFADTLRESPVASLAEAVERWGSLIWPDYFAAVPDEVRQAIAELSIKPDRTADEAALLNGLISSYQLGFCLAGYVPPDRTPGAAYVLFSTELATKSQAQFMVPGETRFWGVPNIFMRVIFGMDEALIDAISKSDLWKGTRDELIALTATDQLSPPWQLPIREAIDWVHTCIYTTNQALKFSSLAPVCGGPIEIAVVTTDRPFRWVTHKRLDAALSTYDGCYDTRTAQNEC